MPNELLFSHLTLSTNNFSRLIITITILIINNYINAFFARLCVDPKIQPGA